MENNNNDNNGNEKKEDGVYIPHNPLVNRVLGTKIKTYCCKSKKSTGYLGDDTMVGENCTPSSTIMCNPWSKKFRCNNDNGSTLKKNKDGIGFITTDDEENRGSNCNYVPGIATRVVKDGLLRQLPIANMNWTATDMHNDGNTEVDVNKIMEEYSSKNESGGKKTKRTKKNKKTKKQKNKKTKKQKKAYQKNKTNQENTQEEINNILSIKKYYLLFCKTNTISRRDDTIDKRQIWENMDEKQMDIRRTIIIHF